MSELPETLWRELQTKSGDKVYVFVQWPTASQEREDEFLCKFGVETSEKMTTSKTFGTDQIQALYLALRGLHSIVDKINSQRSDSDRIIWRGGMNVDDLGLPRWDSD